MDKKVIPTTEDNKVIIRGYKKITVKKAPPQKLVIKRVS